jgi:hypothetical protein
MPKRPPDPPLAGLNPGGRIGETSGNCPGPGWPTTPPAGGHEEYSLDEYVRMWEADHCRKMTPQELRTLKAGCIGITALNLGTDGNPPLNNCYATLPQAKRRADEMKAGCASQGKTPRIFSKRFWSSGQPFTPDPTTGKVDMSGYKHDTWKPGDAAHDSHTNFDYGWYDERSNSWWHANHGEFGDPDDPMKVYRSSLPYYSRPLCDFDQQVFGVTCGP